MKSLVVSKLAAIEKYQGCKIGYGGGDNLKG
jgi:hypothetical protein